MIAESAFVTRDNLQSFNDEVVKFTKQGLLLEQLSTCWSPVGVVYTGYFVKTL